MSGEAFKTIRNRQGFSLMEVVLASGMLAMMLYFTGQLVGGISNNHQRSSHVDAFDVFRSEIVKNLRMRDLDGGESRCTRIMSVTPAFQNYVTNALAASAPPLNAQPIQNFSPPNQVPDLIWNPNKNGATPVPLVRNNFEGGLFIRGIRFQDMRLLREARGYLLNSPVVAINNADFPIQTTINRTFSVSMVMDAISGNTANEQNIRQAASVANQQWQEFNQKAQTISLRPIRINFVVDRFNQIIDCSTADVSNYGVSDQICTSLDPSFRLVLYTSPPADQPNSECWVPRYSNPNANTYQAEVSSGSARAVTDWVPIRVFFCQAVERGFVAASRFCPDPTLSLPTLPNGG